MPATELGLADIEERLRSLCRRINTVTAVHGASLCVATIVLAAALRVGLGPSRFAGSLTWLTTATCLGVLAWAVTYVRRNWLRPAQAARLVDRQAEMCERVTTLFELGPTATGNPLLPVLLMQVLNLGERWQPQRLVPRPYPKTVYLVALSLLGLAAAPLLDPALPAVVVPPSPAPEHAAAAQAGKESVAKEPQSLQLAALSGDGEDPGAGQHDVDAAPPARGSASAPSTTGAAKEVRGKLTGNQPGADAKPSAVLGALPDALRRSAASAHSDGDGKGAGGRAPGKGPQGEGDDDERKGEGAVKAPNPGLGQAAKPDDTSEKGKQRGAALPAPNAAKAPADAKLMKKDASEDPQATNQGSSPGAGSGSDSVNLLGVRGGKADAGAPATGTFKLTLSSFLNTTAENHAQRNRDSKHNAAATSGDGQTSPAVSEHQIEDDAQRKASIPPEYEEIVKRVYSRHQRP